MRHVAVLLVLLLLPGLSEAEDGKKKGKPKLTPPPDGIRWEKVFEGGMTKAAREGRPIFLAVNALENERANNQLAASAYPSKAWGEASRPYVAFVCNPGTHGSGAAGTCSRYPAGTCRTHQRALRWFLGRFGQDLISPQHVILEPDGDVAYRKEYFTGVVGPKLLDRYLTHVSPKLAYGQAASRREKKIREVAGADAESFPAAARLWLKSDDGLAAAGLVNVLDDAYDAEKRLAVIGAFADTPAFHAPMLAMAAEERVLYPDDEPTETKAWVKTLFDVDRTYGVWAATRVIARTEDAAMRNAVLALWKGQGGDGANVGIGDLPEKERPFAYEALLIVRDPRAKLQQVPLEWRRGREAEIRRAKPGRMVVGGALKAALKKSHPGLVRNQLLDAPTEEVVENEAAVVKLLTEAPAWRVRIAAALRILETRKRTNGLVTQILLRAIEDPIEGEETRHRASAILGDDPGQNPEEWRRMIAAHIQRGGR